MRNRVTALINTTKEKAECAVCGENKQTKVIDRELNGRVCNDCVEPLLTADHVLNNTRGFCRPKENPENPSL